MGRRWAVLLLLLGLAGPAAAEVRTIAYHLSITDSLTVQLGIRSEGGVKAPTFVATTSVTTPIITSATANVVVSAGKRLGIGVTPETWTSVLDAMQIGEVGTIFANADGAGAGSALAITANIFHDGTEKYIIADEASRYLQVDGTHKWNTAVVGAAGGAITWVDNMFLAADGELMIGTTTGAAGSLYAYRNAADAIPTAKIHADNASQTGDGLDVTYDSVTGQGVQVTTPGVGPGIAGAGIYSYQSGGSTGSNPLVLRGGGFTGPVSLNGGDISVADDGTAVIETMSGAGSYSGIYLLTVYNEASGAGAYAIVGIRSHIAGGAGAILAQGGSYTWEFGTTDPTGTTGANDQLGIYSYAAASIWYVEVENRIGASANIGVFNMKDR